MSIPESMKIKQGRGRPRILRIPKSFQCLGHVVEVKLLPYVEILEIAKQMGLFTKKDEAGGYVDGLYDHSKRIIYLNVELPHSALSQSFLHELTHCILEHSGNSELSEDESFVDLFGELLYQVIITQKFPKKVKL